MTVATWPPSCETSRGLGIFMSGAGRSLRQPPPLRRAGRPPGHQRAQPPHSLPPTRRRARGARTPPPRGRRSRTPRAPDRPVGCGRAGEDVGHRVDLGISSHATPGTNVMVSPTPEDRANRPAVSSRPSPTTTRTPPQGTARPRTARPGSACPGPCVVPAGTQLARPARRRSARAEPRQGRNESRPEQEARRVDRR